MTRKEWLDKFVSDFEEADTEDSHLRAFYERWLKENDPEFEDESEALQQKADNEYRDSSC